MVIGEISAGLLSGTINGHWFTTEPRGDRNGVWIDRYGFLEDLHPGEGFIEGVHRLYAEATAEELVSGLVGGGSRGPHGPGRPAPADR